MLSATFTGMISASQPQCDGAHCKVKTVDDEVSFMQMKMEAIDGDLAKKSALAPSPSPAIKILSFNLEGRGGNQAHQDGKDRRAALKGFFDGLCEQSDKPQVIITQEDMDAEINDCYQTVIKCKSEDYWWNEQYKFGDGKFMLNKVYIRKDLASSVKESFEIPLTTLPMLQGGLNPRCASVAKLELNSVEFAVASFHLSGGYVDDEIAKAQARDQDVKDWIKNLRSLQLQTIRTELKKKNIENNIVIGGDTNGFPKGSVQDCQGGRIKWMADDLKKQGFNFDIKAFEDYITTPSSEGTLTRVSDGVADSKSCKDAPNDPKYSTSIWGGRVDAFFTNAPTATAKIDPIGLGSNADKAKGPGPFYRILSDHNPVWLTVQFGNSPK